MKTMLGSSLVLTLVAAPAYAQTTTPNTILTRPAGEAEAPALQTQAIIGFTTGAGGAALPMLTGANTWSDAQLISKSPDGIDGALQVVGESNSVADGSKRTAMISTFLNINNTAAAQNGYTAVGNGQFNYVGYGQWNPRQLGSWAVYAGQTNVYNMAAPATGRSENTPIAIANLPIIGGSFASGQNFYYDYNLQTTPTSGQEGYLGYSFAIQKRAPGNVIDVKHNGSTGISVFTTPNNIGFDPQDHRNDTTYPMNAMITLAGWSGKQSAARSGGQMPDATPAALVGLQIGGNGGSVWQCHTCYSYIPVGIDIRDYTTAGIRIGNPSTNHSPANVAIHTDVGAGNLVIGDSIYSGGPSGGGVFSGRRMTLNALPGTQAVSEYGDSGTIRWQVGKQVDNSFFLWDGANARNAFQVTAAGNVILGEGAGTTITLDGPTTGLNAYFMCMSAAGVVQIQASACTISSQRFKDITSREAPDDALAKILKMHPMIFSMKENMEASSRDGNYARTQIGLIAEEIAAIDDKAAIFEQDGKTPKSYRQESLIALLVGATKAQEAKIEKLQSANEGLEARLAKLEQALKAQSR